MDWQLLITDLIGSGMTQRQIAEEVGKKSQSWAHDVSRGKYRDIPWHDGEKLRALHALVMRRRSGSPKK